MDSNFTNMFKKMFLPDTKEEYIALLRKNEDRMNEIETRATLDLLVKNMCCLLAEHKNISYEAVKSAWDTQMDKGIEMYLQAIADMLYEEVEK